MSVIKSLSRPEEISALFKLKFGKKQRIKPTTNTTSYTDDIKYCFDTLDAVSRSFAMVIRQLPNELSTPVCIFYLILRALDSIEDDMDCPKDLKLKLLREFYTYNYTNGWTIANIGDKKEYRALLENYDKVIRTFLSLDENYQDVITEVCRKMGAGMADFVETEIDTLKDYDLYCHYVAGLVGIGLSQLFTASEIESENFKNNEQLSNSMGLFLQKTNIIRDYQEDLQESRAFWPKEVWNSYAPKLEDLCKSPESESSITCLNHLTNNVLHHVIDCLEYLKMITNKNIFRFCAIPQVMAIATLCEVYNNPKVFVQNVKIRKGLAAKLIVDTNTFCDVVVIFKDTIAQIENKIPHNTPDSKETVELLKHIKAYLKVV